MEPQRSSEQTYLGYGEMSPVICSWDQLADLSRRTYSGNTASLTISVLFSLNAKDLACMNITWRLKSAVIQPATRSSEQTAVSLKIPACSDIFQPDGILAWQLLRIWRDRGMPLIWPCRQPNQGIVYVMSASRHACDGKKICYFCLSAYFKVLLPVSWPGNSPIFILSPIRDVHCWRRSHGGILLLRNDFMNGERSNHIAPHFQPRVPWETIEFSFRHMLLCYWLSLRWISDAQSGPYS